MRLALIIVGLIVLVLGASTGAYVAGRSSVDDSPIATPAPPDLPAPVVEEPDEGLAQAQALLDEYASFFIWGDSPMTVGGEYIYPAETRVTRLGEDLYLAESWTPDFRDDDYIEDGYRYDAFHVRPSLFLGWKAVEYEEGTYYESRAFQQFDHESVENLGDTERTP